MGKKRKTLPKEMKALLESGELAALKEQFSLCEPNALTYSRYGSNIFSLSPLPREFAVWAKEQGADVNFRDHYGRTPIFDQASAWQGDVGLLIDLGAKADVANSSGVTPLHLAALYGRASAVKALLEAGVDVNVRSGGNDWPGALTPLEKALLQDRLPYGRMLEICRVLLEHGAEITDRSREFLGRSAERFQRARRGIGDLKFLREQMEGLEGLCRIFDVEVPEEEAVHDGTSPIHVPGENRGEAFRWLWNYLVPPGGRAQTAQGEIIRIAGRIDHEITANGGGNWDGDYRKMLRRFPQYLRLGDPLGEGEIARVEEITRLLRDGRDDGTLSMQLCAYAVAWVLRNPEVLPPLEAEYTR